MLIIENIWASYYEGNPILRDINLRMDEGDRLVIMGRNGAGKTTFANSIFGSVPHINGRILFEGRELLKLPKYRVGQLGIGYFMQGAPVFPQMSVGENLLFVSGKKSYADIRMRTKELSESIELLRQDRIYHMPAALLSGGERTQLALAMVLFKRPKLLLLDEPFAGLSPANSVKVLNMLNTFHAASGAAMILIAQDRHMAEAFSNIHYFLRNGKLKRE